MPKTTATNTRWLEKHGPSWRVTVGVPKELRGVLGTRLKQPLGTDSLAVANRLKLTVVATLQERIEHARQSLLNKPQGVMREAAAISRFAEDARSAEERREIEDCIRHRAQDILGAEVGYEPFVDEYGHDDYRPVHDPRRERLAGEFVDAALGKAMPLPPRHEEYMASTMVKRRTKADDERAMRYLATWCERERIPMTLQAITPKVAIRFRKALKDLTGDLHEVTQNKYLNRLSGFWKFLIEEQDTEVNPFAGVKVKVRETPDEEKERPFTEMEVQRLLMGPAEPKLKDLMTIAALTGARIDAVVDLKVRHVRDGAFRFKKQKKESGAREVPIHPALAEIVARRVEGKSDDDEFFPEWPAPPAGSQRERSFKASNAFTAYRRSVGVDEVVEGKRRALVNFHSFRRWFITKAERTGYSGDLVAAIVGHKRAGITLSRYSAGPEWDAAEDCIARVQLPPLDGSPVVEKRSLRPRDPAQNPYLRVPSKDNVVRMSTRPAA